MCAVDSDSMFDSITPSMAATECLIATVAQECAEQATDRLAGFEGHQLP